MTEQAKKEESVKSIESLFESPEKFVESLTPEQLKGFNVAISKRLSDEEIAEIENDIPYEIIANFHDDRVEADSHLSKYKVFSYQSKATRRMVGSSVIELFSSSYTKDEVNEKLKFKNKQLGGVFEIFNKNNERYKVTFVCAESRDFNKETDKKVKF